MKQLGGSKANRLEEENKNIIKGVLDAIIFKAKMKRLKNKSWLYVNCNINAVMINRYETKIKKPETATLIKIAVFFR